MLHCTTAHEIWTTLQQIFYAQTMAQLIKYKTKLQTMRKREASLREQFVNIQQCVDALASIGKIVPSDDHIMHILVELGSEYDSMICVISAKTNNIILCKKLLLSFLLKIEQSKLIMLQMVINPQPILLLIPTSRNQSYQYFKIIFVLILVGLDFILKIIPTFFVGS